MIKFRRKIKLEDFEAIQFEGKILVFKDKYVNKNFKQYDNQ